jgi:hypothetical protein
LRIQKLEFCFIVGLIPGQVLERNHLGLSGRPTVFMLLVNGATQEEGHDTLAEHKYPSALPTPCRKDRNIEAFVICTHPGTKSISRNRAADHGLVSVVDDAIAIQVFVSNVPGPNRTKLGGVGIHFFLGLEQPISHIPEEGAYWLSLP